MNPVINENGLYKWFALWRVVTTVKKSTEYSQKFNEEKSPRKRFQAQSVHQHLNIGYLYIFIHLIIFQITWYIYIYKYLYYLYIFVYCKFAAMRTFSVASVICIPSCTCILIFKHMYKADIKYMNFKCELTCNNYVPYRDHIAYTCIRWYSPQWTHVTGK